ncbi:MAG: hypothetical protein OXI76_11215 [Gemmatimonadota bacterium]|nr:hypothetical protein [Gemmatimonadota bacterium]
MLNAIQKRVWGEECDFWFVNPTDFVEAIEPAIADALNAIDDHERAASVLLHLYHDHDEPGTLARLLESSVATASGALYEAVEETVSQSGSVACVFIALLKEGMAPGGVEKAAVGYLFDGWRAAVHAIRDPAERLRVLRNACEEVLEVARDRDLAIAERLGTALQFAGQEDDRGASVAMLAGLGEDLDEATDQWSIIEALFCHRSWCSSEAPLELRPILWKNLRTAIAGEGPELIWKGHRELSDEWTPDTSELLLPLHDTYLRAVGAVTDVQWLANKVLDICSEIAYDSNSSCWLPSPVQVARACIQSIVTVAGTTVTHGAFVDGLERALDDPDESVYVLVEATRALVANAVDASEPVRVLVDCLQVPSPGAAARLAKVLKARTHSTGC